MLVLVLVSLKAIVGVLSQLSVAVGEAGAGTASHWTESLAGQPARTGAVVSLTVRVWEQLEVLPQLSVAVQVRVMV